MRIGDRRLELATASAYLAEAHWRWGGTRAARTPRPTGLWRSRPRRGGAAPAAGSSHRRTGGGDPFGGRLTDQDVTLARDHRAVVITGGHPVRPPPRMVLEEFGPPSVTVDGEVVPLTLTKSLELLCFLVGRPEQRATRQQILDAVFDGRNDASSRSYLRQALFRLRAVLPADLAPPQQDGAVYSLPASGGVVGTARSALDLFALAARQPDEERLSTLQDGIGCTTPGPYLMTLTNEWVTSRRVDIGERIANAVSTPPG